MASKGNSSGSHTRSGSRRFSNGSSSTTSMSTTGGLMTPSTGSSTPGRQSLPMSPEYGSTTVGYHTSGDMMLATPSDTLANLGREPLPAQTGVSLPGDASISYPQQAFDSSQWGPGHGVDARTDPGQMRYATPGPGTMDHGSSGSSDDMAASTFVFPPSPPRPLGARSSTAVGETKSKTKTKMAKSEKKKGGHTRNWSASSMPYNQAGSYAPGGSLSSAGPYAPAGPHQPYPSAGYNVPTQSYPSAQPYPSAGYNFPTQSYASAQSDPPVEPNTVGVPYASDQSHLPGVSYFPAGANTSGMYDTPAASSTPGMSNTIIPTTSTVLPYSTLRDSLPLLPTRAQLPKMIFMILAPHQVKTRTRRTTT